MSVSKLSLYISLIFLSVFSSIAQTNDTYDEIGSITTAVPFLTIVPDSRSAGMGDLGVATSPDANSSFWNPAKYPFYKDSKTNQNFGVGGGLSYAPWLRNLVPDMSVSYLSGYKRIRKEEVLYASFKFFDLGSMTFRDDNGFVTQEHNPYELALSVGYSRMLSKRIGASLGAKWIHSNLTGGVSVSQGGQVIQTQAGNSVAMDLGFFYQNPELRVSGKPARLNIGATITDLGSKMTYTNPENAQFIPTKLRLGSALEMDVDQYNKFGVSLEFSKLMVPSEGGSSDKGLVEGVFGSFADASFKREMQEIMMAIGAEYIYANALALRAGYYYENPNVGSRRHFTLGLGLMYKGFGFDFAYLIPTDQNNPLQNTIRFTLTFDKIAKTSGTIQE